MATIYTVYINPDAKLTSVKNPFGSVAPIILIKTLNENKAEEVFVAAREAIDFFKVREVYFSLSESGPCGGVMYRNLTWLVVAGWLFIGWHRSHVSAAVNFVQVGPFTTEEACNAAKEHMPYLMLYTTRCFQQ